jgi:hypothetical protein
MPPWCAVALIIKATGVQVNVGGALQGATGQRGAIWYMYNGTGTPPAGTFVGELDGDWCIRKSDGENFQRVSGAWVDQSFTNRSTAAVSAGRMLRSAAWTMPASASFSKIPLDTTTYDTGGMASVPNGRITCPTAGYYEVNANVMFNISTTAAYTQVAVSIYKNGAQGSSNYDYAAVVTNVGIAVSDVIYCNAGDYLELWAMNSQGTATLANPNYNYLSAALITAGPGPVGPPGPPGLGVQPAAQASLTPSWAAPNAFALIPFNVLNWSQGGITLSSGGFKVPSAGIYQVNLDAMLDSGFPAGRVDVGIANMTQKAGITDIGAGDGGNLFMKTASFYQSVNCAAHVQCNANDVINAVIYARAGAGSVYGGANWTLMSISRVSDHA